MDDAARSLGVGAVAHAARACTRRCSRAAAAAALLLVFVDVMKELPATLVLRPFNFDTLATQTYTLAKDERLAEAALPSLAIVAVGLLPDHRAGADQPSAATASARGRGGVAERG